MAGDWIPMRCDLADDPAVIAISESTGIEIDLVVGKLHRLWSWANRHLVDGNARGVTEKWVDAKVGVPGFAKAMAKEDWLRIKSSGIVFPEFDAWNSQGAKKRQLTAKRVAKHKAQKGNADSVTEALPKEEKRRVLNTPNQTNVLINGSRVDPPGQNDGLGGVDWDRKLLRREDLGNIPKLLGWCRDNRQSLGFTVEEIESWDTQERIVGAAVRAAGIKRGDHPAVFVGIVQKRLWKNLSDEQIATGKRLLGEHYRAMRPVIPVIGRTVE